jgi:protein TonB
MFDVVLAGHPVARRRRLAAPVAVAAHALVLGAVLAVSAWKIGDVPEPSVPIVFAAPASPPADAGTPAGEKRPPDRHPSPPSVPAPRVLPASVPDVAPPIVITALPAGSGDDAGLDPGAEARPGGLPGGVPGSAGSGQAGGAGSDGVFSERAPNVVAPRLLRQVPPEYPESARRARLQGIVVLQAVIGIDGGVDDVRVLSSASPLFEEPAVRAVRQWRYSAATLDGRAVRVYLTATITFAIH